MSEESTTMIEQSSAAQAWPVADEQGRYPESVFDWIAASAHGALLALQIETGWLAGFEALLPEATASRPPHPDDLPCDSRFTALLSACEALIFYCSEQKVLGGKKHKKAATELQDWALQYERTLRDERLAEVKRDTPTHGSADAPEAVAAGGGEAGREALVPASQAEEPELHTSAIEDGELRLIPIEDLHESPWNPRQYYPEAAMAELVESMRASGFREWLPLMVRPETIRADGEPAGAEYGYEIGAGHRRRRAAEAAGIKLIPCVVRPMTDEQFLDVLNFDNTGREDVHPLHEASGWRVWMEKTGKGVLDIAARIGQSKEYVYQRLKYAALIPEAQAAFMDGKFTSAHAILIARLQAPEQKQALKYMEPSSWESERGHGLKSVRDLAGFIQQDVHLEMSSACFDLNSGDLFPAAGPCSTCNKRTKNSPELMLDPDQVRADLAEGLKNPEGADDCTDPACFHAKVNAHLVQVKAKLAKQGGGEVVEVSTSYGKGKKNGPLTRNDYETVAAGTKGATPAVVTDGLEVGKVIHVKIVEQKSGPSAAEAKASREKQEAASKAKEEAELAVRRKILRAVTAKVGGIGRGDLEALLLAFLYNSEEADALCDMHGIRYDLHLADKALNAKIPKMTDAELFQLAVEAPVAQELNEWGVNRPANELLSLAKRYKVDAAKIRAEAEKAAKEAEGGTRREVEADPRKAAVAKLPTLDQARKPAAKKAPAKKPAGGKAKKAGKK